MYCNGYRPRHFIDFFSRYEFCDHNWLYCHPAKPGWIIIAFVRYRDRSVTFFESFWPVCSNGQSSIISSLPSIPPIHTLVGSALALFPLTPSSTPQPATSPPPALSARFCSLLSSSPAVRLVASPQSSFNQSIELPSPTKDVEICSSSYGSGISFESRLSALAWITRMENTRCYIPARQVCLLTLLCIEVYVVRRSTVRFHWRRVYVA